MARNFTRYLREIDDADLNVYQFRILVHIWRVGHCYEKQRTTAEKTGMSLGSVNKSIQELEAAGWIEKQVKDGRMGYVSCSLHEQTQQLNCSPDEHRSPHEQVCSPDEQVCSPDEQPTIKSTSLRVPHEEEIVWADILELRDYFLEISGLTIREPEIIPVEDSRGVIVDDWNPIYLDKVFSPLIRMKAKSNGTTKEMMKSALAEADRKKQSVSHPCSIETIFMGLVRQQSQPAEVATYEPDDEGYF